MKKFNNVFTDPFDEVLSDAIKDPIRRYHFYKAFMDLEVIVLGSVSKDDGEEDPTLHLKYIEVDKELVLPIYSTRVKFDAIFQSKYRYVKIKTRQLLQLIELDVPWILNPGYNLSKKIIPEELETLRDGRILHYYFNELSLEEKQRLFTDQIVQMPDNIMNAVSDSLQTFPSIKKAYLTNIYNPVNDDGPIPLIGLEVDGHGNDQLNQLVLTVFKTVNQYAYQQIEIALLTEALPLTNAVIGHIKPFYVRPSVDDLKSMFH
ncbi:enhanced serine sensitivity protein SseB C-terminal domain-containing protein [Bacillus salipaludis]|uniref:Enhanced serine sensitivity protein SseB C-terminal domain-containing protein n=1 Tax=Bacillus salipaludis TaxID=2547811 RepID=A0ABW8RFR3_9BACI